MTKRVIPSSGSVNGLSQFIDNSTNKTTVLLDSNGILEFDNAGGSLDNANPISAIPVATPGALMRSVNAFGRVFTSFFSQNDSSGTKHLKPSGPIRYWPGPSGFANPGRPGSLTLADGGVGVNGKLTGGNYSVRVVFIFSDGSMSVASSSAGIVGIAAGHAISITNIPVGPTGCIARWILITQSGGVFSSPFFVVPMIPTYAIVAGPGTPDAPVLGPAQATTIINNNFTSTLKVDIADADIQNIGFDVTGLVNDSTTPVTFPPLAHLSPEGPADLRIVTGVDGVPPGGGFNLPQFANSFVAADYSGAGNVVIGVHQVSVVFETIFGFLSQPSAPFTSWNAAGAKKAQFTGIPVGPWYVVARRIIVTLSGGVNFQYIPSLRIPDNSTTVLVTDFADSDLANGLNVDYLFRNLSVSDAVGVDNYGGRLTIWGMQNSIRSNFPFQPSLNFGFDGGWNIDGTPTGWTSGDIDGTQANAPGGFKEMLNAFAGQAWRMKGNGVAGTRGMISTRALAGTPGSPGSIPPILPAAPPLQPGVKYTISVRAKKTSGLAHGLLDIDLISWFLSGGTPAISIVIPNGSLTTSYQEFIFNLTDGLPFIPSDLTMRMYMSQTGGSVPENGESIYVDHIKIYPAQSETETSVLRVSNPFDPETFDSLNGFLTLSKDDGQKLVNCRQLRSFYYVWKERSMHLTYDDGQNPPSLWYTRQVDGSIGQGSPNGAVSTDTFMVFGFRAGSYIFSGGRPVKISQEIQTTWERINWQYATSMHAMLDPQKKRAYFFVPLDSDTKPNNALVMDYSEGMGEEDDPGGRKWALDVYPASKGPIAASLRFENPSLQQVLYLGGTNVYEHTGTDDDGVAIDSFYETAFLKAGDRGTDLFGGSILVAEGSGHLVVTVFGLDNIQSQILNYQGNAFINLGPSPGIQYEMYANLEAERAKLRFETNALGAAFTLKTAALMAQPWAESRIL